MTESVKELDQMLFDLMDKLKDRKNINLVMFSDHGMAQKVEGNALIDVLKSINEDDIKKAHGSKAGPVLYIWPEDGKLDEVC